MLGSRQSAGAVGLACAIASLGCGGTPDAPDTGTGPGIDTGMPITMTDAGRDAFVQPSDPFANYEAALTAAFVQECECNWMAQGFKSVAACVEEQNATGDFRECSREGYMVGPEAAGPYYECQASALYTYAECRVEAGCEESGAAARMACVDTIGATRMTCPELPRDSRRAESECILRDHIGSASMCPEPGAPWMGLGTFTGDTTLAGNDSNPTCVMGSSSFSPDRAYRWVAPAPGAYQFDTVGTEFDTVLYVRSGGCTGRIVGCQDDVEAGVITTSQVVVSAATAGEEFVVVVDGFTTRAQGPFTVTVTMAAPFDAGMSGPDAGMP